MKMITKSNCVVQCQSWTNIWFLYKQCGLGEKESLSRLWSEDLLWFRKRWADGFQSISFGG